MGSRQDDIESGYDSALNLTDKIIVQEIEGAPADTTVSVKVDASFLRNTKTPTVYYIRSRRLRDDGTYDEDVDADTTLSFEELPAIISGLTPEAQYKFEIKACIGETCGATRSTVAYQLHKSAADNRSLIGIGLDPSKYTTGKSYLTLSNTDARAKKSTYGCLYRPFQSIKLAETNPASPQVTSGKLQNVLVGANNKKKVVSNFKDSYYLFGTVVFMDPSIDHPEQGAALGFFIDGNGTSGYYLNIESTTYSASKNKKTVKVIKVNGSSQTILKDTQITALNTFEGVYGGATYNISVKVKVSGLTTTITCDVNGFKFTAIDKTSYTPTTVNGKVGGITNQILTPTKNVGLVCTRGKSMFDYVYATTITASQYNESGSSLNPYTGQFSDDLLNIAYGDLMYNSNNTDINIASLNDQVDEFGTTVREIYKASVKFESRPSYPIKWSVGANNSVSILGSTRSNFASEAYVLNNTTTTVPLSDGNTSSMYLIGNTLADSGTLEYTTDDFADYVTKEPVIFESQWIQNEAAAKDLAEWIKLEVVNRGKVVNITTFGNPLLSLGDIVTINYPFQGFNGTEKFIVISIEHSYDGGLETTVTCRLISGTVSTISEGSVAMPSTDSNAPVDLANATVVAKPGVGSEFERLYDSTLAPVTNVTNGSTGFTWTKGTGSTSTILKVLLDGKWKLLGTLTEDTYSLTGYTPGMYLIELFPATEKLYGPGNIKSIQVF
jgi:hypothetical protein